MTKITVIINPIDKRVENTIAKATIIDGNYSKLTDNQIDELLKYLVKNKINLTIADVLSIRSSYMSMKIMINNRRLLNSIDKFYKMYKKNITIKQISEQFDLSPILLIKHIFSKMKFSKDNVRDFFMGNNLKRLTQFDTDQLTFAIDHDIFNKVIQTEQMMHSENFELLIEKYLKMHKIKYKTQNDLSKEQIKKYGKAINTPDFLILSDFFINKKKINWIDAKNFYGANTKLINKKVTKQVRKYIDEYGFGSIIFSLNFSKELHFDDVLLVSFKSMI
jgi:hypothetical protein